MHRNVLIPLVHNIGTTRYYMGFLVAQTVKSLPTMRETRVWSLGQEDPLEKEMATQSSTLAWKILWTEEPGRLQYIVPQWVGHDRVTSLSLPSSWKVCMQVKKQQIELDMKQQKGSKLGKEYVKAVYCHPAYLTYVQSTSSKMPGWMKHKLESRLQGEISITSDMQMIPPLCQKMKRN